MSMAWKFLNVAGIVLLLSGMLAGCDRDHAADETFAGKMADIEAASGGRIGVYAIAVGTDRRLAWRAGERFAMASTFKPLLVAAVLADVEAGSILFDDSLDISNFERQSYSPVIDDYEEAEGSSLISVRDLCDAAITVGDNTASNMLLSLIGGPAGLTTYLRSTGDSVTRLDREETALNENLPGDERDTTTPAAMVTTLDNLLLDGELSDAHARVVQDWMVASTTGKERLRAGLPAHWRIGDKTGTGMNGAVNNIAIAWPPESAPIIIAVYLSGSEKPVAELNSVHADIARLVISEL